MRDDERYVMDCLSKIWPGKVVEGEDPPDGYLVTEDCRIAVEVSTFVEPLRDKSGKAYPRIRDDKAAENLANYIKSALENELLGIHRISVGIGCPVSKLSKTREQLRSSISEMLAQNILADRFDINGSVFTVDIDYRQTREACRFDAYFCNRYSDSKLTNNVEELLADRIRVKTKKISRDATVDQYWLALFNDYWLASPDSYRVAYRKLAVKHPFDRIYVVDGYKQVHRIDS